MLDCVIVNLGNPNYVRTANDGPGWLRIAALILATATALVVAFMPTRLWIDTLLIGDASAYSIIANNITRGAGLTYDGITETNGFHPLWLILHLPIMIGSASPMARLWLVKLLVAVTGLAAALIWGRVVKRTTGSDLAGSLTIAWVGACGWSVFVVYSGIETPLALLMAGATLLAANRRLLSASKDGRAIAPRDTAFVGLLMGLTFLARLDVVFLLIPLAVLLAPTLWRAGGAATAAWGTAGLAPTVPYLLFNKIHFGYFQPVSGLVKTADGLDLGRSFDLLMGSVRAISRLAPEPLQGIFVPLAVVGAVLAIVLVAVLFARLPRERGINLLAVVPIAALLHYVYYFLRFTEINVMWHIYLEALTVLIVLSILPGILARQDRVPMIRRFASRALPALLIVLLILTTAAYTWMKQKRRTDRVRCYVAAEWLDELPPNPRMGMYDGWHFQLLAGPRAHVVELSGLVGDREMALLARDRDYHAMIGRYNIDYLLGWPEWVEEHGAQIMFEETVPWNHRQQPFAVGRLPPTAR